MKHKMVRINIACSAQIIANLMLVIVSISAVSVAIAVEPAPAENQNGYRAFIDPDTGQLTSLPQTPLARQGLALGIEELNAMRTEHAGLRQEVVPGKGIKLDLQGRFMSSTFATVQSPGEISISHTED